MNDYTLINALLEDGSDQAILKLKMIFDFNCFGRFDGVNINHNRYFMFAKVFENQFSIIFSKTPSRITYCCNQDKLECIKFFKSAFEIGFKNEPMAIKCFDKGERIKVIKMFNDCFKSIITEYPKFFNLFPIENIIEVIYMYEKEFEIGIKKSPKFFQCNISTAMKKEIKQRFPSMEFPI